MTTSHSKTKDSNTVIEQIRKTLLNYDLQIARVESEIELRTETMDFHCCSTKKADLQAFEVAKVEKENYELFLYRLKEQKKHLLTKVNLIAEKYEGKYAQIFKLYFFEKHTHDEIATIVGYSTSIVNHVIARMKKDLINI